MPYRFRLRLAAKQPGKFAFGTIEETFDLPEGIRLSIVARNADTLDRATGFHMEAGGFESEERARAAGEALRVRLRLLNGILGLGLNIPHSDTPSARVSDEVKRQVAAKTGGAAIDSVWGLLTFPDDGKHFEYVLAGRLEVRPSDPSYIFAALKVLWPLEVQLDNQSEEALHVLGLGTLEASEKAAFLTSYLALEQLIDRRARSGAAKLLIASFRAQVQKAARRTRSPLPAAEAKSLVGALSALNRESFSVALVRFARSIVTPQTIRGIPTRQFFSACIDARNRIAHHAEPRPTVPLAQLTAGLREVVVALIWTRNKLPPVSFNTPASSVSAPAGVISMRVL